MKKLKKSDEKCRLVSDNLIIAPQDPGEPPSWVPTPPDCEVIWLDREIFDELKKQRYNKPCDICPDEIKSKCELF